MDAPVSPIVFLRNSFGGLKRGECSTHSLKSQLVLSGQLPFDNHHLYSLQSAFSTNNQLVYYLENHSLLNDRQYGFEPNRYTGDLLVYFTHLWDGAINRHWKTLAISLDMVKAFDRVWYLSLVSKLPAFGLPRKLCNSVAAFLHQRHISVPHDGVCLLGDGLRFSADKRCWTSLFLLYINYMLGLGNIHCNAIAMLCNECCQGLTF